MRFQTTTQRWLAQGLGAAQVRPEVHDPLDQLVADPAHNVAWTQDVNRFVSLTPTGTHSLPSGVTLYTAKLPVRPKAGGALKVKESSQAPSALREVIHEIAGIPGDLGNLQVLITLSQLCEELFETEQISKVKVAATAMQLLHGLLDALDPYLPNNLPPYVKIIVLIRDVGEKLCAYLAEHDETSPASQEGV